jgi:hypothetical protein
VFENNRVEGFVIGWDIQGSDGNAFTFNNVNNGGNPGGSYDGFQTFNSTGTYCHNTTGGLTKNDFLFWGSCTPTDFSCNYMGSADFGLHLAGSSTLSTYIDEQENKGNIWDSNFGEHGAFHASSNPFVILDSRFTTNEIVDWSTGAGQNILWFDDLDFNETPLQCDNSVCPQLWGKPGDVSGNEAAIAKGELEGVGILWMAEQRLFKYLEQSPELIDDNTDVENFYEGVLQGNIGQLHSVKSGIKLLESRSVFEQEQLSNSLGNLESEANTLLSLKLAGPGNDPLVWETAIALQTRQIESAALNYQSALSEFQVLRVNESTALISENTGINPVNVMAVNEKAVNEIYLRNKLWSTAELSVLDINSVKSIADQCPHEGGLAVYTARNIYQRYFPTASWAGNMICSQERTAAGHISGNQKFQIQPNPANGWVMVVKEKPLEQDTWIKIVDINGKVIQSLLIPKGSTSLNIATTGFLPGFYFYQILEGGFSLQQGKLIIMH